LRESGGEAEAIDQLGEQRRAEARHESLAVRSDFYLSNTAILWHPQGDPPGQGLQASLTRMIPAQEDVPSVSTVAASGRLMNDPGSYGEAFVKRQGRSAAARLVGGPAFLAVA